MSEDSRQQEAIRMFLLHQLSFVSGKPELALAEQLIDVETQAFLLEPLPSTSSEQLNPELQQAQELPIFSALDPIAVAAATASGLPPNPILQSRLPPIPEEVEGVERETYLFLGCCPIFLDCQSIVRNWIRAQGRSILYVLRGD